MFGSRVYADMTLIINTHDAKGKQMWFVALQKWTNYMIDLHTYQIRIANASGIITRILRIKVVKMGKTENSHQDEQLLKQWLRGKKAQKLHVVMQKALHDASLSGIKGDAVLL